MKKRDMLVGALTVVVIAITVVIFLLLLKDTNMRSDAISCELYSEDFCNIETYTDDSYIIKVYDSECVVIIPRDSKDIKKYSWGHVIKIDLK